MQIATLITHLGNIEQSKQSIFESIGRGDQYFRTWEKEIHPILCEVALSPDQIQALFKGAEAGAGRSALGKIGDTLKGASDKISDVWFNKFGGMLQSSTPVQAFDQKWEDLKSKVAAKHPDLAAKLAKYGEFAKNNPNLHKFLLAIGGSLAAALGVAAAGGIGAGALAIGTGTGVAVGILNIADRLLQGQKASTAIGRGATAGLVAGLTAGAIAKAKDALDQLGAVKIIRQGAEANFNGHTFYMKPEEAKIWNDAVRANVRSMANVEPGEIIAQIDANAARMAEATAKILDKVSDPAYQEAAYKMLRVGTRIEPGAIGAAANAASSALTVLQPVLSAIAGQAAGGKAPAKSAPMSESQINELFGITGNKVDASSLEKAWKRAGSPTDSDEIAKILQGAGVSLEVISKIYTDAKIPAPAATPTATPATATTPTATTPTSATPTQPGAEPPATAQATQQSNLGVGQINKIIPTLRVRDLTSVKKTVDATLAKRGKTAPAPQPTAEGKYVGFYSKFLGKDI